MTAVEPIRLAFLSNPGLDLVVVLLSCLQPSAAQLGFKQPDTNPDTGAVPVFSFQTDGYASDQARRRLHFSFRTKKTNVQKFEGTPIAYPLLL
jgi:hypothetical protein